ncbi:MAG TPA: hypothetical protein DEQ09_02810 [Bacteroidales bacterium]|nr:hypothetical protein [Bacteroidales bacterium]
MKHIFQITLSILIVLLPLYNMKAQEKLNLTDKNGYKQGHWIKKHPNGNLLYEGYFSDNKPVSEFKRYDEDGNLKSVLNYRAETDTVDAVFYHPNGYIAGKGKYYLRKKTGEWKYYSDYVKDHMLMKCIYMDDKVEGLRLKYHWNGDIAEEMEFKAGEKTGEWKQYYTDGTLSLESSFVNDKRNGEFKTWHTNGKHEITGCYNNDIRTGKWLFFNNDGSLRKEIRYNNGIPENRAELIKQETEYLDKLEKEGGKIKDPEITGIIK